MIFTVECKINGIDVKMSDVFAQLHQYFFNSLEERVKEAVKDRAGDQLERIQEATDRYLETLGISEEDECQKNLSKS
jgi:hypothetical protein